MVWGGVVCPPHQTMLQRFPRVFLRIRRSRYHEVPYHVISYVLLGILSSVCRIMYDLVESRRDSPRLGDM